MVDLSIAIRSEVREAALVGAAKECCNGRIRTLSHPKPLSVILQRIFLIFNSKKKVFWGRHAQTSPLER
jgi:hypothetical protein